MGAIKMVLSNRELPDRELHNSRLFVDLSENVHIHFRELRLMFGIEEFFLFCEVLSMSRKEVRYYLKKHPEYQEQKIFEPLMVAGGGKQQTSPLRKSPQPHVSKYFPRRLQIELQEENVIDSLHIHYRDFRLAMSIECFREFSQGVKEALDKLDYHLKENNYRQEEHPFRKVVVQKDWEAQRLTVFDRLKRKIKRILNL